MTLSDPLPLHLYIGKWQFCGSHCCLLLCFRTDILSSQHRDAVIKPDKTGEKQQVNRINYELYVLKALREKVRSKELWVRHGNRFRNPDNDLPKDFETKRTAYYEALHQPQDVETFITQLQREMGAALEMLNQALPNSQVQLLPKEGGWISLSPLEPQPEPTHLRLLKTELSRRWSMIGLLDILKETDLRVPFTP
jgi:hypothetical protein